MERGVDVLGWHRCELLLVADLIGDCWEGADLVARDLMETTGTWVDGTGSGEIEDIEGLSVGDFDHVVECVPWHWCAVAELVLIPDCNWVDGIALDILGCSVVVRRVGCFEREGLVADREASPG